MNRIVVSGASGDLGRRVTELLLNIDPNLELTLVTRNPGKLAEKAAPGVRVCHGDYEDAASLESAYQGGDVLLLISSIAIGSRIGQHRNAIEAAKKAGIRHIVYVSLSGLQRQNPTLSAKDHYQTEEDLRASGLEYTFLRDGLYAEIVATVVMPPALQAGVLAMAAGAGRLAPVSKRDVAQCATNVLLQNERHAGAIYEITGPELLSFADMSAIAAEVHGTPLRYMPVSIEERQAFFDSLGYPRHFDANMKMSADGHMWASDEMISGEVAVRDGFLGILSDHVEQITGTKPESFRSVLERCRSLRYDRIDT